MRVLSPDVAVSFQNQLAAILVALKLGDGLDVQAKLDGTHDGSDIMPGVWRCTDERYGSFAENFPDKTQGLGCDLLRVALALISTRFLYEQGSIR